MTVSPPHRKNRREERDREKHKGLVPQCSSAPYSRVPTVPQVSGDNAMGKALYQISQSPFLEDIEKIDLPRRFIRPTFTVYDGKTDLVE